MQKSLHIDPGKYTGCLQCEMACSYENTGRFNPATSGIMEQPPHSSAGLGDAAAPVLSGELIL